MIEDLFGAPAEERASDAGVARIPESKAPQSLSSYEIVARFLSPGRLPNLLDAVKQVCMRIVCVCVEKGVDVCVHLENLLLKLISELTENFLIF